MVQFPAQLFLLENAVDVLAGEDLRAAVELQAERKAGPDAYLWGRVICRPEQLQQLESTRPAALAVQLDRLDQLALVADFHARAPRSQRVEALEAPVEVAEELGRRWLYPVFFRCAGEPGDIGPPPRAGVQISSSSTSLGWVRQRQLPFKLEVGSHPLQEWLDACLAWHGLRGRAAGWSADGLEAAEGGLCSNQEIRRYREQAARSFTVSPDWSPPWC